MTLAVDITDGCGLSNEVHRELLLKKGNPVFAIHYMVKGIYSARRSASVFESGCIMRVGKLTKEDWPRVLQ